MSWATDAEIKALAQQIGIGGGTLPTGWANAATAASVALVSPPVPGVALVSPPVPAGP